MRTVTVTGQGVGHAVPDVALLSVSVGRQAPGVAEAHRLVVALAGRVREIALAHLSEAQVRTTGLHVWAAHSPQGEPAGFEARHSFALRCGSLDVLGALLDDLAEGLSDALRVDDVSLGVADPAAALRAAREAAFADARARAEQLATLAGLRLGGVLELLEGDGGGGHAPVARFAMAAESGISPGESSVPGAVRVTFALDDLA